jgi:hypothetical protein
MPDNPDNRNSVDKWMHKHGIHERETGGNTHCADRLCDSARNFNPDTNRCHYTSSNPCYNNTGT